MRERRKDEGAQMQGIRGQERRGEREARESGEKEKRTLLV